MSQGNGPIPLQVGVRITIKSTNVALHKSSSDKYAAKTYMVLPFECIQLNPQYEDQGWFLFVPWDFTVRYNNLKQGDQQITLK